MFDLNEVKYVKRIVVGSNDPTRMLGDDELKKAQDLLNRCMSESPKGSILGIERSFTILQIGEHQVVLQWLAYHVGFPRKPIWLGE